jgi:hypothetical protein
VRVSDTKTFNNNRRKLANGIALFGIPGYTFKGIHQEIQNHFGAGLQSYIIAIRTAEGLEDYQLSTKEERLDVINKWQSSTIEKKKTKPGLVNQWQALHRTRKQWEQSSREQGESQDGEFQDDEDGSHYQTQSEWGSTSRSQLDPLDTRAVQWSNRRDEHSASACGPSSVSPSTAPLSASAFPPDYKARDGSYPAPVQGETDSEVHPNDGRPTMSDAGASGQYTERSGLLRNLDHGSEDDEGLRRALEASAMEDPEEEARKQEEARRREEEIVLEYVKKQSLAEEQHRQALLRGQT